MSTTTLAPAPAAGFDVDDEMFDLDIHIVPSPPVPLHPADGGPGRGYTDTDNCVMTDKCTSPAHCD